MIDHETTLRFFLYALAVGLVIGLVSYWIKHMRDKRYRVGFIFDRCFIQKPIELPSGAIVSPLPQTGFVGRIHEAVNQLTNVHYAFSEEDLQNTLRNFSSTGHCTLVKFESVTGKGFVDAIESKELEAENIIGAVSAVSANPATPLCSFAQGHEENGVKFHIPPDRIIRHATNIPGFLDALPDIEKKAQEDSKFSLLLKLFRSSLREADIDNQILFQLILFEEASDDESGSFAERLRAFSEKIGFSGDLAIVAPGCGVELPKGKDAIDLLVKLRNSVVHNGNISEESLRECCGEWVVPILSDKAILHKLVTEALRYMFCCMAGHTRDEKALRITGPFELRFD